MAERDMVIHGEDFPGNSHRDRNEKTEKKVKVVHKAKVSKKPVGKRAAEAIVSEDTGNVMQYILYDVLIPAFKNTLSDIVSGGIQMLLFGSSSERDSRIRRDRDRSYVSYSKYYDRDDRRETRPLRSRYRDFDSIGFDTRDEAEEVLSYLIDYLDQYDYVSVGDFFDIVGMTSEYTDQKWGWYNLNRAVVKRHRRGYYYVMLPHPQALD